MQSSNPGRFFLCLCLALLFTGCDNFQSWTTTDPQPEDMPWAGENFRAIEKYKEVRDILAPEGKRMKWRWKSASGTEYDTESIADLINTYLDEKGWIKQWPEIGKLTAREEIIVRNPPFIFTIVSIEPVVVLMTPIDYRDLHTTNIGRRRYLTALNFKDDYYHGISAQFHPKLQWFSPELRQGPGILGIQPGGDIAINLGRSRLILSENAGVVSTRRE